MPNDLELQRFIENHLEIVRPLGRDSALAWWENALTGSDEAADRASEITARLLKVYANPDEYAFLDRLDARQLCDPLLARQHDMLRRSYLAEQMPPETIDKLVELETEVNQEYNHYRAVVRGETLTENDVRTVLRESEDAEYRRETWEESKRLGERVAGRVLEMVRLRNEVARAHGFPNHYAKAFALDELDEERVFAVFDELIRQSDPFWEEWKSGFDRQQAARFGITVEELRPWHYTDVFFQEAPSGELNLDQYFEGKDLEAITKRFFTAIDLPIESVLERSDLYEKPGKNQHAFCTDIDRGGDVRVLCNNKPNERWMGTMLHEFGHAVYDLYTDRSLPYLLRGPAHTLSTEAIAELMGRFSKDGLWLQLYADVPAEEAAHVDAQAQEEQRVQFLISTRWIITMARFEREMYRNPDQDLNKLWWDMVERYQGVRRSDGRDAPDWAAKLHLALAPVYYQNYLLGEMMAAQLLNYLRTDVLASEPPEALFTSPKVGQWLREKIFQPGQIRAWEAALEYATGERLNPSYFVAQLRPL
jgi:peptidyl-dipeptidase A